MHPSPPPSTPLIEHTVENKKCIYTHPEKSSMAENQNANHIIKLKRTNFLNFWYKKFSVYISLDLELAFFIFTLYNLPCLLYVYPVVRCKINVFLFLYLLIISSITCCPSSSKELITRHKFKFCNPYIYLSNL